MQQSLSIVQVTDQLNVGGAEQIVVLWANLLQAHGHRSAVVTTIASGSLASQLRPGVQLINLRRGWKWNPVIMRRLVKVLNQYDVVHVHSAHNLRYVLLAGKLFFLRKPVFYHEHYGNAANQQPGFFHRYLLAQTCFIAVSHQLAQWATTSAKMPANKVFVLPNTVMKAPAPATPWQQGSALRLCTVGNILPNKNVLFLLQVLHALQQKSERPVQLTIIGTIADAGYYRQLLQYIAQHQLTHSVLFVHDCNDVQPMLRSFDVGLHGALSESGPLALIEFLAQGLPFVAYRTGEVAEQLAPHLPDNILPHFEEAQWVQAIEKAAAQPRAAVAAGYAALYEKMFSPEDYYARCMEIYKTCLQLQK